MFNSSHTPQFFTFENAADLGLNTPTNIPKVVQPLTAEERAWLNAQSIRGLIPQTAADPVYFFARSLFINVLTGIGTHAIISGFSASGNKQEIDLEQAVPEEKFKIAELNPKETAEVNQIIEQMAREKVASPAMQAKIEIEAERITTELSSSMKETIPKHAPANPWHIDFAHIGSKSAEAGKEALKGEAQKIATHQAQKILENQARARLLKESASIAARATSSKEYIARQLLPTIFKDANIDFVKQSPLNKLAVSTLVQGSIEFAYQSLIEGNPLNAPENIVNTGIELAKTVTLKAFEKIVGNAAPIALGVFGDAADLGKGDVFYTGKAPATKKF